MTSWWFFATPLKNMRKSNWIISPIFGVKIKNVWNHHLVFVPSSHFSNNFECLTYTQVINSRTLSLNFIYQRQELTYCTCWGGVGYQHLFGPHTASMFSLLSTPNPGRWHRDRHHPENVDNARLKWFVSLTRDMKNWVLFKKGGYLEDHPSYPP